MSLRTTARPRSKTLNDLRNREPVPPRQLTPRLSRDLKTIILKCIRKDPIQRYPTAQELAEDLRRWLDDRPIQARPVPLVEHGWRWCRRRPAVAGLVTVLATTILAGLVVLYGFYRHAEDQRMRAEAAREVAEENLEIASTLIGRIEDLILAVRSEEQSLQGERLYQTASPLREQATRTKFMREPEADLLDRLRQINSYVVTQLGRKGRWDEALTLVKNQVERVPRFPGHGTGEPILLPEEHRGTYTGGSDGTECFATRASPRTLRAGHLARARGDGHPFRATTRAHGLRAFRCPF